VDGPWQQTNLDGGASLIIAVPAPLGGVIVVGEQSIVYLNGAYTRRVHAGQLRIAFLLTHSPPPTLCCFCNPGRLDA
jgi:hypothetical protein